MSEVTPELAKRETREWLEETVVAQSAQMKAALALHWNEGESQGYNGLGKYIVLDACCGTCGEHGEYGVQWPCPTARALGVTK